MKYKRNCPKCDSIIEYTSKYNCRYAELQKKLCKKCMHVNKSQKQLYGDRYDEIIKKRSSSLKKVNHWWHDKIAESRRKNNTYKITEDHKQKIIESTIFSKKEKDHVKIRKILNEQSITYEQYLNRLSDYKRYNREVRRLTRLVDVSSLKNYDKRGKAGVTGAYHLDHKLEISEGYVQGINPIELAKLDNLQFIPWEENVKKRKFPNGIHYNKVKNYYD